MATKTAADSKSLPDQSGDTTLTKDTSSGHEKRRIGRWFIGETLGKGGYSWVKKGVDRKNGRIVALKFMERRLDKNNEWKKSQQSQIKNEIETLKMLRHEHIVRLLAYNLNAKYPDRGGKSRDVILLVLEYAAGGELFDILYYTEKLEPILARTYFRQLLAGIECMHNNGIIHRDIKPQNLLLDQKYNLKITDFGLSKIDPSGNSDILMNDWHVGTRGYQAPEVLLRKNHYNKKVDIFAMGVVLFILLGGYPPFEHAKESDKWYRFIVSRKYKNFWKSHRNCGLRQAETDLITRMICYDPNQRISLQKIKKHPWYTNKEILQSSDLAKLLRYRHSKMEVIRSSDPNKQKILQTSAKRPLRSNLATKLKKAKISENALPPPFPENEMIHPYDTYTNEKIRAFDVLDGLQKVIEEVLKGKCIRPTYNEVFDDRYDEEEENENENNNNKFDGVFIDIFNYSIAFECAVADLETFGVNNADAVCVGITLYYVAETKCNLVKFTRLDGDNKAFLTVVGRLTDSGGQYLSGLDKKNGTKFCNKMEKEDEKLATLYAKCFPTKSDNKIN